MSRGVNPYKVSERNELWIISVGQRAAGAGWPWPLGVGRGELTPPRPPVITSLSLSGLAAQKYDL